MRAGKSLLHILLAKPTYEVTITCGNIPVAKKRYNIQPFIQGVERHFSGGKGKNLVFSDAAFAASLLSDCEAPKDWAQSPELVLAAYFRQAMGDAPHFWLAHRQLEVQKLQHTHATDFTVVGFESINLPQLRHRRDDFVMVASTSDLATSVAPSENTVLCLLQTTPDPLESSSNALYEVAADLYVQVALLDP